MEEVPIVVGLDVGTTKVCALVARLEEEVPRVIGVGIEPSRGMSKGLVTDIPALSRAVAQAIEKAERTSGLVIESALVSLAGAQVSGEISRGVAGVRGGRVGERDIARALEAAQAIAVPHNREVIHVVHRGFILDEQEQVHNPLGMYGYRLEAEVYVISALKSAIANLRQAVEATGVEVAGFVLNPLAAGEAVLQDTEREMGVVVVDIGGGTTDLAVYIDGDVWHTAVIPLGGNHITNDLVYVLHLPPQEAEQVKVAHGHAVPQEVPPEEFVTVHPYGEAQGVQLPRWEMAQIIEARVREIFQFVKQEIHRSGYEGLLPAGVVLTGGVSDLPGVKEVAREVLGLPVRIAKPERVTGMTDRIRKPAFATSVGLLYWPHLTARAAQASLRAEKDSRSKPWLEWLRRLLP